VGYKFPSLNTNCDSLILAEIQSKRYRGGRKRDEERLRFRKRVRELKRDTSIEFTDLYIIY
jgi:hypothetical protein